MKEQLIELLGQFGNEELSKEEVVDSFISGCVDNYYSIKDVFDMIQSYTNHNGR